MNTTTKLVLSCLLGVSIAACTEPGPVEILPDPTDNSTGGAGVVTEVGKPIGTPIIQTIGPAGGNLTTPDGQLTLMIPAGAVNAATSLTLQPVEHTLPGGAGMAFTIAPKGLKLAKPASVVWNYTPQTISGSAPELVGIAYQDDKGAWRGTTKTQVDKTKRTIQARLRSFAHPVSWFEQFYMEPNQKTILPNERVNFNLFYQLNRSDETPDEAALVPLVEPVSGEKFLEHLTSKRIETWKLNGELKPTDARKDVVGDLVKSGGGYEATYMAPKAMLAKADNPVAISVDLNLKQKGFITLVSNLTMVETENEFKIKGENFKNAYLEVTDSKGEYLSMVMQENAPRGTKDKAALNLVISGGLFTGTGTYVLNENDKDPKISMTAGNGKEQYGSYWVPLRPAAGTTKYGPISITISEYGGPGKPIGGHFTATLHRLMNQGRSDEYWEHVSASGRFRVIANYFQGG